EGQFTPVRHANHRAIVCPANGANSRSEPDLSAKGFAESANILLAAASDGLPCRLVGDRQQAVVIEEAQESFGGELQHPARWCAPYRGAHGNEIPIDEGFADAELLEVIAQGHV